MSNELSKIGKESPLTYKCEHLSDVWWDGTVPTHDKVEQQRFLTPILINKAVSEKPGCCVCINSDS